MNRRDFLKVLGASGGVAATQSAALRRVLAHSQPGSFLPTVAIERDPVLHAINRLTYGPTPDLVAHVQAIGVEAFINEQLAPELIADSALERRLAPMTTLTQTAGELAAEYEGSGNGFQVRSHLIAATLLREIYTQRQLYERMVEFWTGHFSIYLGDILSGFLKVDDDRDVIRPHALGRFRDLLGASAHSPAMLVYLDNATSRKEAPNENYARELMELHTLGVDGGYTETDVKEVARCFTGWTINPIRRRFDDGSEILTFRYQATFHDDGEKTVLGQTIPAGGGMRDGELVLDILASHPSTAKFIATKLVRRFVADDPPQSLVDACAATFLQSDGDIRSVLRTLFGAAEFWDAAPKFKRPLEYTVSVMRALNYDIQDWQAFARPAFTVLLGMGQVPFNRETPDGYPDVQEEWTDNLLTRWNIAIAAAHGGIPGAQASLKPLLEANNIPIEAEPILNFFAGLLYGRGLTSTETTSILNYVATDPTNVEVLQDALALLMAAPAFQYR